MEQVRREEEVVYFEEARRVKRNKNFNLFEGRTTTCNGLTAANQS